MTRHAKLSSPGPAGDVIGGELLPYHIALPILGVPIVFHTNAPDVLVAVRGAFGAWAAHAPPDLLTEWTGRVQLMVFEKTEPRAKHPSFEYHIDEHQGRLTVRAGKSVGHADSRLGRATARVTRTLALDTANFQYGMIQALTLFVITGRDRYPLHAATLVADDTIVLLMGDSGAGKSTLAFALHQSGMAMLSEDVAYLSLLPAPRVWASPGPLHLMADAARHFPVLRDAPARLRANGKEKVGVSPRPADPWRAPQAQRVIVCLLARTSGEAGWAPAAPDDLTRHLASAPEGFNRFLNQLPGVARQLARFPTVRIALSNDPHQGARAVLEAVRSVP
jgi:hypothetical protein